MCIEDYVALQNDLLLARLLRNIFEIYLSKKKQKGKKKTGKGEFKEVDEMIKERK